MNNLQKFIIPGILLVILISAAAVQPQLSMDEQSAIIEAVVQTMNPENMKATVIAEVRSPRCPVLCCLLLRRRRCCLPMPGAPRCRRLKTAPA